MRQLLVLAPHRRPRYELGHGDGGGGLGQHGHREGGTDGKDPDGAAILIDSTSCLLSNGSKSYEFPRATLCIFLIFVLSNHDKITQDVGHVRVRQ